MDDQVISIDIPHWGLSGPYHDDSIRGEHSDEINANRQRESLLLELQTMTPLRRPHTVNVYGAITSRKDRLVLVMELLTGGDLHSFLRQSQTQLPEAQARQIVEDVCAGMSFLHSKNVVHGDLKSPKILLDGEGRAKVRQTYVRHVEISLFGWCSVRCAHLAVR